MKTAPITPATIAFDAAGVPHAPAYGDRYHPRAGALAQAEHVFLRGNGLPRRWSGRPRFVILETGFGLGLNFLATWAAWQRDPARCDRLHYVAVEKHPPTRADLARVHAAVLDETGALGAADGAPPGVSAVASAEVPQLAARLRAAWPPLTGDLHRLAFDRGRVELLLAFGDAATWLRRMQLQAAAIYLDGFAPEHNADMWSDAVFAALPALSAPDAAAATWSVARRVRDGLAQHGFVVERAPGFAAKREMTVARFAPRHRPALHARRQSALPAARDAIVIGAGLAGAAAALALVEQGLAVVVLEGGTAAATGASGNVAGLVRGLMSRDDGAHARWHRAAALEAQRQIAPSISAGLVPGRLEGVLHLADDVAEMRRRIASAAWPADYVQALDAEAAAAASGVKAVGAAWCFPGGGWVDPGALVRHALAASGAELRTACRVARLQRRGARWIACDEHGRPWAEADLVVLANAADAARLAPAAEPIAGQAGGWKIARSRGQVTRLPASLVAAPAPLLPLARNGYIIPMPDGSLLCGATQTVDDDESALREADHAHNIAVLARLTGSAPSPTDLGSLAGRVGWRCHTDDRLPLVGALPAGADTIDAGASRLAQPRHVPREPGLFALTALGSRGITSAALGGRVLAAWVCGTPLPVDTDLLDAVDAGRYRARAARVHGRG